MRSEYKSRKGLYELAPGDWTIRWTDRTGKQRKMHVGQKSLAMEQLAIKEAEAAQGIQSISRRKAVLFTDLVDLAVEHVQANYARPADDLSRLRGIRTWFGDKLLADEVTTADVRNALARNRKAKNWSDSSCNHHHSLISLCYRLGLEAELVKASPIHGKIKKSEENNDRKRHLSADEETRLFEAIKSNPVWADHAVEATFAIHTGLRRTDMYKRLKWENVDLLNRTAKIPRSKNKKPLVVPLNTKALECLAVWRIRGDGTGRVVRNDKGETLDQNEHWFPHAVKQAQIPDFRWHDLRHTYATRLRAKRVPLEDIATLLGHSRKTGLAMTMRYADADQVNLAKAVDQLAPTIRPELALDDEIPAQNAEKVN
jgi:integrase